MRPLLYGLKDLSKFGAFNLEFVVVVGIVERLWNSENVALQVLVHW